MSNKEIKNSNDAFQDETPKYPGMTHKKTIAFVDKIYNELGSAKYHSREDIAKVHDLKVSSTKVQLTAAQQFGLMELKFGEGLKVTPLFVKITRPADDSEKNNSIIDSIK